jgi:Domain of unknown function (DUF6908)
MKTVIAILNHALPLPSTFHIQIENAPYMPLTIEGIGTGPRGQAAISVCHYGEQNGDLMRDPEMCFEVETNAEGAVIELYPYYWRNDYIAMEQQSVFFEGTDPSEKRLYRIDRYMMSSHAEIATLWDRNLASQGFDAAFLKSLPLTEKKHTP